MDEGRSKDIQPIILDWLKMKKSYGVEERILREWFTNSSMEYSWDEVETELKKLMADGYIVLTKEKVNQHYAVVVSSAQPVVVYKITDKGAARLNELLGPVDAIELKKQRYRFLDELYSMSRGSYNDFYNEMEVGARLGFSPPLTRRITDYLRKEKLIRYDTPTNTIAIDHEGVRQIEDAQKKPGEETKYFPPVSTINVTNSQNVYIQQSGKNSNQNMQIGSDRYPEMLKIVEEIKESMDRLNLESEDQSELMSQIYILQGQLTSRRPMRDAIRSAWESAKGIIEGAGGTIAAELIMKMGGIG